MKKTEIENLVSARNVLYSSNADVWSLLFNLTCENVAGELSNEVDMYLRLAMARLSESMSHVDQLELRG